MATMPKCSAPAARTRGVSRPLGFCKTKPSRALAGRGVRRRGMVLSFREEERYNLNPKGREGEEKRILFSANPHTTVFTERSYPSDRPKIDGVTAGRITGG